MTPMTWEEWHAFITTHLGAPVVEETAEDGATWFTSGDPGEVMVRLKGGSIAVFESVSYTHLTLPTNREV